MDSLTARKIPAPALPMPPDAPALNTQRAAVVAKLAQVEQARAAYAPTLINAQARAALGGDAYTAELAEAYDADLALQIRRLSAALSLYDSQLEKLPK